METYTLTSFLASHFFSKGNKLLIAVGAIGGFFGDVFTQNESSFLFRLTITSTILVASLLYLLSFFQLKKKGRTKIHSEEDKVKQMGFLTVFCLLNLFSILLLLFWLKPPLSQCQEMDNKHLIVITNLDNTKENTLGGTVFSELSKRLATTDLQVSVVQDATRDVCLDTRTRAIFAQELEEFYCEFEGITTYGQIVDNEKLLHIYVEALFKGEAKREAFKMSNGAYIILEYPEKMDFKSGMQAKFIANFLMGLSAFMEGEIDIAEPFLRLAGEEASSLGYGNNQQAGYSYYLLGAIALKRGDQDKMHELFSEATKYYSGVENNISIPSSYSDQSVITHEKIDSLSRIAIRKRAQYLQIQNSVQREQIKLLDKTVAQQRVINENLLAVVDSMDFLSDSLSERLDRLIRFAVPPDSTADLFTVEDILNTEPSTIEHSPSQKHQSVFIDSFILAIEGILQIEDGSYVKTSSYQRRSMWHISFLYNCDKDSLKDEVRFKLEILPPFSESRITVSHFSIPKSQFTSNSTTISKSFRHSSIFKLIGNQTYKLYITQENFETRGSSGRLSPPTFEKVIKVL